MTPLFDYVGLLDSANEANGAQYTDYYEEIDLDDEDIDQDILKYTPYYGRNVIWMGEKGRMIRCSPEYTSPIVGNIFDPDKLLAIKEYIENPDTERAVFTCCVLADPSIIDIDDVRDTQVSAKQDRLWEMYLDRPFTTGDDELDEYLVAQYEDDLDQYEAEELIDFEDRIKESIENGEGDLGQYWITIRDGNHRVFGAFAAGERYIYAVVLKDSLDVVDPDDLE